MRVIVETQGAARRRLRTRVRRAVARALRRVGGMPVAPDSSPVTFRRVSRLSSAVGRVMPLSLIENPQIRSMTVDLALGALHAAFAVVNIVAGLLARSVWTLSVGVLVATLNAGKSYLASGALMSVVSGRRAEDELSLWRCLKAGIALVAVTLALSGTIARIVLDGFGRAYPGVVIYLYAAYALVAVVLAIVNLVRARRFDTLAVKGVRLFGLASALISIFALQTVVLSRVDWGSLPVHLARSVVEGAVGGAVCLYMVAAGLWLALSAGARLRGSEGGALGLRARRIRRGRGGTPPPSRSSAPRRAPVEPRR